MGLIQAAKDTINGMLADQWREYFYCDAMPNEVLVTKGKIRVTGKNGNKGVDNIISNGSIIAVNEGQCMIIVDQGEIVEFCADAGEFVYDASTEPSLFYGNLSENLKNTFKNIGKRFTFGGSTGKDQRVYYFNIKEVMGNLFGTASPIPFRIVDNNIGLDVDTAVKCNGQYSFKIIDPLLFYKNVCGNVSSDYDKSQLLNTLKTELLTALQPALAKISAQGIRYYELAGNTEKIAEALNEVLSEKWSNLRGIEIVSIGFNSVKIPDDDEKMIKELQKTAVMRNANMAAATLVGAQAEAMKAAASNTATGPMMAFAGMNMATQAGGFDANALYAMGAQQQAAQQAAQQQAAQQSLQQAASQPAQRAVPQTSPRMQAPVLGWTCSCGRKDNMGKFCEECGSKKPENAGWTCGCGAVNQGKFCSECGGRKPAGASLYRCDKCGWEPEDPAHPPKFCPECGDIFDDSDIVS